MSNKPLIIKQINFVARTPTQLEAQVQCLGSEVVSFNDIMLQLLQQNLGGESTPASTVLQNLIPINESIVIADTVTITGTSGPYVWYPGSGRPAMNYGIFSMGDIKQNERIKITGKIKVDVFRAGYAEL